MEANQPKPILTIKQTVKLPPKLLAGLSEQYHILIVKYHDDVRLVTPHEGEATEMLLDFAITAMKENWSGSRDAFARMVTDHIVNTRSLRRQASKKKASA